MDNNLEMKQQPIPRGLDRLNSNLDNLNEALAALEGRLGPVMSNNPTTSAQDLLSQRDPNPAASSMTLHLEDFAEAVIRATEKIRDITDALEV